jgi:hypothetical protein
MCRSIVHWEQNLRPFTNVSVSGVYMGETSRREMMTLLWMLVQKHCPLEEIAVRECDPKNKVPAGQMVVTSRPRLPLEQIPGGV